MREGGTWTSGIARATKPDTFPEILHDNDSPPVFRMSFQASLVESRWCCFSIPSIAPGLLFFVWFLLITLNGNFKDKHYVRQLRNRTTEPANASPDPWSRYRNGIGMSNAEKPFLNAAFWQTCLPNLQRNPLSVFPSFLVGLSSSQWRTYQKSDPWLLSTSVWNWLNIISASFFICNYVPLLSVSTKHLGMIYYNWKDV